MKESIKRVLTVFRNEFGSNKLFYVLVVLVLFSALFVRVYRTHDLLGFYFDQGRDALVIWRLWYEGKLFLIGPVTGLAGIFLGPSYYYLIAPFYLIGSGDPAYPAVFLALLSVCALGIVYSLGLVMHSRLAGLIAATIGGFSYYLILASRWLANPTPILLTSVILLLSMWKIVTNGSKLWWIVAATVIGLSLQLESASAIFYIPMFTVFSLWVFVKERNRFPKLSILVVAFLFFILTLMPQVIFNFRHENILFDNFTKLFIEEKGFRPPLRDTFASRLDYFWGVYSSKLYPGWNTYSGLFTTLSVIVLLSARYKNKLKILLLFAIFLGIPMTGYVFFQGNFGNIYDYYMTGYYLPMVLLFSIGLAQLAKTGAGRVAVIFFFVTFFMLSGELTKNYLKAGVDGPTHITMGNQLQAVNWVYQDASGVNEFNTDVYVPPVIPYAYDYLFMWQGTVRQTQGEPGCEDELCGMVNDKQVTTLYLLYEQDPPHPERLQNWLSRYEDNTIIEEQAVFGGITVQRRKRV